MTTQPDTDAPRSTTPTVSMSANDAPVRIASTPIGQRSEDGFVTLPVAHIEYDTDDSALITLDTSVLADDPQLDFAFQHGQHITVRRVFDADDGQTVEVRRSYSLCSPAPDGPLRIGVKRVDGGVFSTWATTDLGIGDTLDVLRPSGTFTHELVPGTGRTYTMVAAGSGITPVFSIAATVLATEPDSSVDLLYVNRSSNDTMLLDDVLALRDRYLERFRVNLLFTRESTDNRLLSGRPDDTRFADLIDAGLLLGGADEIFLCGPEALLDTAEAALVAAGADPAHIHRELFTTAQIGQLRQAPQPVTDDSVRVATLNARLHGRSSIAEIYEGDTVLEAIERVRPDAPFSCRAGVCSTCQARVGLGTVHMDVNVGLTDDEVQRGLVLTCQARPLPDVTEIDADFDV